MKITTKGIYALNAMLVIAQGSKDRPVPLSEISERLDISKLYLEQIFRVLTRAKFVLSVKGKQGGYRLADPLAAYSLWRILSAVENPKALTLCEGSQRCVAEGHCNMHWILVYLQNAIADHFTSLTLADLVAGARSLQRAQARTNGVVNE